MVCTIPSLISNANALTIPDLTVNPQNPTAGKLGKIFSVNVTIASVTNLYGYEFKLNFNTTLLQVTQIRNGTFFPTYPKSFTIRKVVNNTSGIVWFAATLLAPEAPKSGGGVLAIITFNATYSTVHPDTVSCPLGIYDVKLSDQNANVITPNIIDGTYTFVPLRGDVNGDGKVDILDLVIITIAFGSKPGDSNWDPRADLQVDSQIDIYDVVLAANNYGTIG